MKRTIVAFAVVVAFAVLVALAVPAMAADLGPPPAAAYQAPNPPLAYDWTGLYGGANVSYSWASATGTATNTATGVAFAPVTNTTSAWHGGGQVGFDYMLPYHLVIGVVADLSSGENHTFAAADGSTTQNRISYSGTVRGRLGFAIDRVLLYGTGGLAYSIGQVTRSQITGTVGNAGPGTNEVLDDRNNGWTAGGGMAFAFGQYWNVFAEYRYSRFNVSNNFMVSQRFVSSAIDGNVVEVGLNFKGPWDTAGCPWYRRSC